MQHIFIIGSKGIPSAYGGFETFVDKLTEQHQGHSDLKYHIACKNMIQKESEYHNARCFNVKVPNIGAAQAVYYDIRALQLCWAYIRRYQIRHPIIYILACRIGPFASYLQKKVRKLGGRIYVNPDGHEWMRAKWGALVRHYWKHSEKCMVRHADLLICDSRNIEKYIQEEYHDYHPRTIYIAYGADVEPSRTSIEEYNNWLESKCLRFKNYYLVVGRFVPENNFETMIREFMTSKTEKDLAIITTVNDALLAELGCKLHFKNDPRIKFVGTVYKQELLKKIRESAFGYFHGHEVGGTNPSLLEALGSTDLNLLLGVGFNREVAEQGALYWEKEAGSLANLIEKTDRMSNEQIKMLGIKAKKRIFDEYRWEYIAEKYAELFLG